MMLASGYTPIYAAHVPPASYRTGCIGTGPFKVKEWRKGEFVDYVKNPDYFVKGRPYLDGLRYVVIDEPRHADRGAPGRPARRVVPGRDVEDRSPSSSRRRCPSWSSPPCGTTVNDNIIMNVKKPPFDNLKVRLAVSHAHRPPRA